jgi:hypothetical protein
MQKVLRKYRSKAGMSLLAAMLAMSLFVAAPVQAFAATPTDPNTCEVFLVGASQGTYSFDDAVAMMVAGTGDEIQLDASITLTGDWTISGLSFDFYTNGYTLDFDGFALLIDDGSVLYFDNSSSLANLAYIDIDTTGTGGSTVVFAGDVVLQAGSLYADQGSVVSVSGNLTSQNGTGVEAHNAASVTVNGNVVSPNGDGVDAFNGATVTIVGAINAATGLSGVYASDPATSVTVGSDVLANTFGVQAENGASVLVAGCIIANDPGVIADGTGTTVSVSLGIQTNAAGVSAANGATVIVLSDIASGDIGVLAGSGSTVTVVGNIAGTINGVFAQNPGTMITVDGNILTNGNGVGAILSATVSVSGDVTTLASGGTSAGIVALSGVVTIGGNVSAVNATGVVAHGLIPGPTGARVTIEGTVNAATYILFFDENNALAEIPFTAADFTEPTTKAGYRTYTDTGINALVSFVWIKAQPELAPTGDSLVPWTIAFVIALLGAASLVLWARRRQHTEKR